MSKYYDIEKIINEKYEFIIFNERIRMMIDLKDTVELMNSESYISRFIAEYMQTKIRYEKLKTFNQRIEAARLTGVVEPEHDCPLTLLKQQQSVMGEYLRLLELRAKIEHVDLPSFFKNTEGE